MSKLRTVKVQIPLIMNYEGEWAAYGSHDTGTDSSIKSAGENIQGDAKVLYYIEAELPVPEPIIVVGEVKEQGFYVDRAAG